MTERYDAKAMVVRRWVSEFDASSDGWLWLIGERIADAKPVLGDAQAPSDLVAWPAESARRSRRLMK